jgi:type IV pilus assembly protein PilO
MNLSEINLSELDINEIGIWPWPAKAVVVTVVFALVVAAGWYFDWQELQEELEDVQAQEQQLRSEFEIKQRRAAALDDYKQQLAEMEESFGAMLRQLPSRVEVAGLLVDISQTGLSAGLEFELFRPQQHQEQECHEQVLCKSARRDSRQAMMHQAPQ